MSTRYEDGQTSFRLNLHSSTADKIMLPLYQLKHIVQLDVDFVHWL